MEPVQSTINTRSTLSAAHARIALRILFLQGRLNLCYFRFDECGIFISGTVFTPLILDFFLPAYSGIEGKNTIPFISVAYQYSLS
jgi:hypothetical protein